MPRKTMHSPNRWLAAAWLAIALVVLPFGGIGAQSPAPGGAPPKEKVTSEVSQYVKFLADLSRGRQEGGSPALAVLSRPDIESRKVSLTPDDLAHVKKYREQLEQLVAFTLIPPDRQQKLVQAFEALIVSQEMAPGATDVTVIKFEADQKFTQQIAAISTELDGIKSALEERQRAAGLSILIPSLYKPQASAAAPPLTGPKGGAGGAPPPLADDQPAPVAKAAPPTALERVRQRVTEARDLTTKSQKPVESLIQAGERALKNRYFPIARDALEKAAERLVEIERRWRDIADTMKPPEFTTDELLDPPAVEVLTTSLTNAILINDALQRVYPKLGEVYSAMSQNDQAAREITKAVEINPENAKTWSALGYAFLRSDQSDEAIRAFLRSVELDTYVPQVWLGLAKAYARKGENQLAIHYIRRAISKGFVKFEKLATDADFNTLQGIAEFDDLVYLVPGAQPFPR